MQADYTWKPLPQYQPGDIANGHKMQADYTWKPLPPPGPSVQPAYQTPPVSGNNDGFINMGGLDYGDPNDLAWDVHPDSGGVNERPLPPIPAEDSSLRQTPTPTISTTSYLSSRHGIPIYSPGPIVAEDRPQVFSSDPLPAEMGNLTING